MRALIALILVGLFVKANAQTNPPRLIVRGDDMGFSHAGNEALIKTYREGIEQSIEVIVPSPWFPEAVEMLKQNPKVDVGIHLAITSEWDNVKWRPMTYCPSITDSDGYFYPMIWPNKNYAGKAIKEKAWKLEEIEKEFRAQIELGMKKIPNVTHISSHMGCTDIDPAVSEMVKKLANEYKINIDLKALGVKGTSYNGPKKTSAEKLTSFLKMLDNLQPNETYLFVDHPALDSPEMRALHHIGYEDVAGDRQGVVDIWTNQEVKNKIKEKNIQLISYGDLRKK